MTNKFKLIPLLLLCWLMGMGSVLAEPKSDWQSPLTVEGAETVSLEQAKQMHADGVVFIDVRSDRYFKKRHIPGAIQLYHKDEVEGLSEDNLLELVAKDQPFVIYCNGPHCSLSYKAVAKAVGWGFTQVKYFRDGFRNWRLDGNPIEKD